MHDKTMLELISNKPLNTNWENVLAQHRTMIDRIQHERLIHLMVTIFVGLTTFIGALTAIVTKELVLLLISTPLLCLFIGYLFHYRYLENTTQSWYKIEDRIALLAKK
jgi:hypothetical protein